MAHILRSTLYSKSKTNVLTSINASKWNNTRRLWHKRKAVCWLLSFLRSGVAMKSGWAEGVLGTELPKRAPGAEPRWGLGPPEARYVQTVCSCQMLFYAGLLPSPSSISPTPYQKKTSDLHESYDPTGPRQGAWARAHPGTIIYWWSLVPTHGYATGLYTSGGSTLGTGGTAPPPKSCPAPPPPNFWTQ